MVWDFVESNPISNSSGNYLGGIKSIETALRSIATGVPGYAFQQNAQNVSPKRPEVFSTDPPYYDNVGYADLSDFFYVWLHHNLAGTFPSLFSTLSAPRAEELVATPYRHGSREEAEDYFLSGMERVMERLAQASSPAVPITIYYAFKQAEQKGEAGATSTGWETFLGAVVRSGLTVTGTWPMRTELGRRMVGQGSNALASSIVLVCRQRRADARPASWGEFREAMQNELPPAVVELQKAGIAPVDLAQAAIGPGMAVFTRYSGVIDQDGERITVGQALALINEILDRTLAEQEGDFDPDTRWALAWFTEHHFDEGEYGIAETLSKAKNTSVEGLVEAGILRSRSGRVRLLRPEELPEDWDPRTDRRLTVWEMVHHLVRVLEGEGEVAAARLLRRIGGAGETARTLAHSLYGVCDRQKRPAEARPYNALVLSWPEIRKLAQEDAGRQQSLL